MTRDTRPPALGLLGVGWVMLAFVAPAYFRLEGRIVNRMTGMPVDSAIVRLVVAQVEARSDMAGRFSFGDLEITAPDTVVISRPGYLDTRIPLGAGDRETWNLEISLFQGALSVPNPRGGPVP